MIIMFGRLTILQYICSKPLSNQLAHFKLTSKIVLRSSIFDASVKHRFLFTQEIKADENSRSPANKFAKRTHTCGELTLKNVGEMVELCGWVEFQRMNKFCTLRDTHGSTQIIFRQDNTNLLSRMRQVTLESVLAIKGTVVARPEGQNNPKMKTGDIEVVLEEIDFLNLANAQLPFFNRDSNVAKEQLQMQYRYLALRYPNLQKNLKLRSQTIFKMRDYLVRQCEFIDIETPTLFRKTPGGAREFIVPTRHADKFYSLVQSPQQFKQLLMVGGLDRYFQFARCYRDEGAKSDRQPEFTQLDLEMSFVDEEDIMAITENLIRYSWPEILGNLEIPFDRIRYDDAIEFYGTDSPDLRIPNKIQNITNLLSEAKVADTYGVYALVFKNKQQFLTQSVKEQILIDLNSKFPVAKAVQLIQAKVSGNNWAKDLFKLFTEDATKKIIAHLDLNENDVLFVSRGPIFTSRYFLGFIREDFTRIVESNGENVKSNNHKFVWIIDFPLFTMNENEQTLETTHHPFTQPHPDDISLILKDPLKVRGLHYDLVLNGHEIGGGSVRIHQRHLQERIFKMLNIEPSDMFYMLEALGSGAPPHGGIAIGLDRYLSIISNSKSIRDVMAFPKTMEGRDLMSGAPTNVSEDDKCFYHIESSVAKN